MSSTQPTFDDVIRTLDRIAQDSERRSKESERRFKEMERAMQKSSDETDRKLKEASLIVGRLGNRLGEFIEEAVRPAAVRLFRERGIEVHEVHENVTSQRGDEGIEVDLLVVNDTDVIAIECKSKLKLDDVREHLDRLAILKRLLPKYADSRVMGAMAAMVIPANVARYAYREGLFVIGQNGEQLEIRNDLAFVPKAW
jgi:hypothetical protein